MNSSTSTSTKEIKYGQTFFKQEARDTYYKDVECFKMAFDYDYHAEGNHKTVKGYIAFRNVNDFLEYEKTLSVASAHNFYEQNYGNNVEFYDIDHIVVGTETELDIIQAFTKYRSDWGKIYYPEYTGDRFELNLLVLYTPRTEESKKISLHIIIRNGYYFKTTDDTKIFMKQFSTWLKDKPFKIDESVYSNHQPFRVIGSWKYGQPQRKLEIFNFPTSVSSFISSNPLLYFYNYLEKCYKPMTIKHEEKTPVKPIIKTTIDTTINAKLVSLLSKERSDDRKLWLDVGFCLYNIYDGADEGLTLWHTFSKLSDKYDEDYCNYQWTTMKTKNMTIGSLKAWAKEDNLDEYKKLCYTPNFVDDTPKDNYEWIAELLYIGTQTDKYCADKFKELCEGEIFYTTAFGWIIYNKASRFWTFDNKENALVYPILEFFTNHVNQYHKYFLKKYNKENDDDKSKLKQIVKLQNKVGQAKFTKGIIQCLQSILSEDNNIIEKFDDKPELIAFKDGVVFDLTTGKTRDITKEDYLFTHTGYNMPVRNEENIQKMLNIVKSMVHDDEGLRTVLTMLSNFIYGFNKNENFYVITGSGGNGKGVLDKALQTMLGNYYQTINVNQLTTYEKDGNRANSELAKCKWARCVMTTEPETGDSTNKLITSTIKKWTGNDPITTRDLHKSTFTFRPKFTLGVMVNDIPALSTNDGGIQRRMKCVEMPFRFVKNEGQVLKENEKYRDEDMKKTISTPEYRDAFFFILADTWRNNEGKFYENVKVKEFTKEYFDQQNVIHLWFDENYSVDEKQEIQSRTLYADYQTSTEKPITETAFGRLMKEFCLFRKDGRKGIMYKCIKKDSRILI